MRAVCSAMRANPHSASTLFTSLSIHCNLRTASIHLTAQLCLKIPANYKQRKMAQGSREVNKTSDAHMNRGLMHVTARSPHRTTRGRLRGNTRKTTGGGEPEKTRIKDPNLIMRLARLLSLGYGVQVFGQMGLCYSSSFRWLNHVSRLKCSGHVTAVIFSSA